MTHLNSQLAYDPIRLSPRERTILDLLLKHGPMTARQMRDRYFPGKDLNYCRPRITDLKSKKKVLEMDHTREDGMRVAIFKAAGQGQVELW